MLAGVQRMTLIRPTVSPRLEVHLPPIALMGLLIVLGNLQLRGEVEVKMRRGQLVSRAL
jgi:hypothetical protein